MRTVPGSKRGIASGVRSTMINTSIVASIPLVLGIMTASLPYNELITIIGNATTVSNNQMTGANLGPFLAGLQRVLVIFSALIFLSAIFSALRFGK